MQSSMLSTGSDHGVVNPVLEAFAVSESWQIEEIKRGLAEADAGEFATDAEVTAHPGSLTIASAPMRLR
jgi:predicted transcriptional regulator